MSETLPMPIYDPLPMSGNKLKRLGAVLGSRQAMSQPERDLYHDLIRDAEARMSAMVTLVQTTLPVYARTLRRVEDAEVVGRVKTLSTLADKLERTPAEKLPSIHDVAGIRIVIKASIGEQEVLAKMLLSNFEAVVEAPRPPLLIDRVASPSHGYRALHIIVWPCGRPVEVQIRTELQHAWAQQQEVLGDRWGREARYGMEITGTTPEEVAFREAILGQMQELSEMIAGHENRLATSILLHLGIDDEALLESGELDQETLEAMRTAAADSAADLERMSELLSGLVSVIGERTMRDPH